MKDRSLLTKETDGMNVAHTQIVKSYAREGQRGPSQPDMALRSAMKDMVDWMTTMVRVEEMDVLKMEAQR